MRNKLAFFVVVFTFCAVAAAPANDNEEISARLSGTTMIVSDIDTSVDFYTDFLGFREYKRRELDAQASRHVFGIGGDQKVVYVQMLPAEWSKDNPYLSGVNFVQILGTSMPGFERDSGRDPFGGEITLAYSVTNLMEIARQIDEANVPVVTPLAASETGRSTTLTVLDPNGIRIHMYEYNP